MNDGMILFTKCWIFKDKVTFGQKDYWFNPKGTIDGIEPSKIKDNDGKERQCTKIFYGSSYILLLISIEDFFKACKAANAAVCVINDLYLQGITIKEFIKSIEVHNGIDLS